LTQINLPNGWEPREYQRNAWGYLEHGGKRAVLIWHRRAGKDDLALNWAAVSAHKKVATYWHMLPEASQARKAIWEAVNPNTGIRRINEAFPKELRDVTREQEMMIRFKIGSTWQVVGSDNFDSLVGSPPYGVVFSEFALADPRAWSFIRPILAENGGWAAFITTPRGRNHAKKLLDLAMTEMKTGGDWFGEVLPVSKTKALSIDKLEKEKRELIAELGPEEGAAHYDQEWECSFDAAMPGAIYAHWITEAEKEGRITHVPILPQFPVNTCWDLGMDDNTAIWFYQDTGYQTRFLACYTNHSEDLQHYVSFIKDWCNDRKVMVGRGILPHDVRVRELGTGKSREEVLQSLGLSVTVAPNIKLQDGIQATRDLLKTCAFDEKGCADGINALRHYHRERDDILKTFYNRPVHDWSSHFCDALRMRAVERGEISSVQRAVARPIVKQKWR